MKKFFRNICVMLTILSNVANAAALTPEQKEIAAFFQQMYSYSMNMFEAGEFSGAYMPDKQCALMEGFFVKNLIRRQKKNQGCDVGDVFIRYPGFSGADFDIYGKPGKMPKAKLSVPETVGSKASISAVSAFGKTIFFLTMTDNGWRVENALYYERLPTEVNICHGQFLQEATPAQLKFRPACKDY